MTQFFTCPHPMSVIVVLLLIPWGRLHAQHQGASTLLSVNDGLSQGMVFDMLQSSDGFLWIATKDGLNRYDGNRFEVFSPDPFNSFAIAASEVYALFEDSRGWIWVKLPDGMDVYDPRNNRFFHLPAPPTTGYPELFYEFSFSETPDRTIWMTNAGRLWKFEASPGLLEGAAKVGNAFPELAFEVVELPPSAGFSERALKFQSLVITKNKVLLVGSNQGLFRIDAATGQLRSEAFQGLSVQLLGEDKSGQVWIQVAQPGLREVPGEGGSGPSGSEEFGLWVWEEPSIAPQKAGRSPLYEKGRFDKDGYLWTLHEKKLQKWRPAVLAKGGKPEFEWISVDPVLQNSFLTFQCFSFDRSGIAWIGTNGYGVVKINPAKPKFNSYLSGSSQRSLVEDPRGNLITVINPGVIYLSKNFERSAPNPWHAGLPEKWRNFMPLFDKTGNGWGIPEANVLLRIDARTKAVRQYQWDGAGSSLPIFCKNGKLLQVAERGLSQFDPLSGQSRDFPFDKPQKVAPEARFFQHLFEDFEEVVWIIGFEGLIKATPGDDGYRYEYYKTDPSDPSSLSYNTVLSVAEDPLEPHRYLWVGTKSGGLNRLDRQTDQFRHYKKEQGLPDNVVYGVLPDNTGHIWLSTNKGLCRFHVREETTKNFTFADGLQDNEFNSSSFLKMKNGTLVFGGVRGLTVFHPDSLRFNEHAPQTHIVGLKINDKPYALHTSPLYLSHRQNFLTLEFAALEFSNPAQNHYRYQLIRKSAFDGGSEEKWMELGPQNSVQFAGLQPGDYTFRVLGGNNDGLWGETPAELSFIIRPPWWATGWAYLFYALALGGLGSVFYHYRLQQRLRRQENLRLQEMDEFKNRFFTNITHEFRTPLTVIMGAAEQAETKVGDEVKSKMKLIRRNGENLLRLINQILDLAKLESDALKIHYVQGDVLPYLRYIAESLHSFANAQNVMLQVKSKESSIVMDYDPERLLQIVYNLLSNAIKFTPSGGRVTMRAEVGGSNLPELWLIVADTGVGIQQEDLPRIFNRFYQANNLEKAKAGGTGVGLALTRELVNAMNGEISVESEVGKGTAFTVRLPITNKAERIQQDDLRTTVVESSHKPAHDLPSAAGRTAANVNLLIIEDNPDVVEYLADCLQDSYMLDFAYNGRAGVGKALETVPDLIVSDVMMPEKDGFEVVEILKNDEVTSHIPIVLLTAKADVESRIKGLRRGADAYLAKPFHQEELLATLNNLLELRRKLQAKYASSSETKPQDARPTAGDDPASDMENAFLQKARTIVLEHLSDARFTTDDFCRSIAMSQPQLHRKLTALTGKNATLFIRSVRLAKAQELLQNKTMTVSEVAYAVGFKDPKYFSRVFSEAFGVSPSKF